MLSREKPLYSTFPQTKCLQSRLLHHCFAEKFCDNEQEESKQMDGLEVVIVSWVDNEKDREKYFNDSYGDWYYLFFEDKPDSQAHRLMQKFGVVDTPKLVVVKSDGHVLDVDAQKELEDTKKSGMRAVVDFLALVT
uniref:Thioredoxin-like fold domain-containing protein n=1 Tax=Ditylenchus dipsaci TaxID=166011 RepID=A0A915ER16_9BILA